MKDLFGMKDFGQGAGYAPHHRTGHNNSSASEFHLYSPASIFNIERTHIERTHIERTHIERTHIEDNEGIGRLPHYLVVW
jgi:hypothetical protein